MAKKTTHLSTESTNHQVKETEQTGSGLIMLKDTALIGLGGALMLTACKKDEPSVEKIDHPIEFTVSVSSIDEGFIVNDKERVITVPKNTPDKAILRVFENNGIPHDLDGGAMIKSVSVDNNVVTIMLTSINGSTGQLISTPVTYDIIYADVTINFPDALPGSTNNTITAGDGDFFSTLYDQEYSLNNGEKTKANKILVNGLEIDENHIINVPGTYTVSVIVTTPDDEELNMDYTLVVKALEIVKNSLDKYEEQYEKKFTTLNFQFVDRGAINGLSEKMKFGAFEGLLTKVLKPSGKRTAVVEIAEVNHTFDTPAREIIYNNDEVDYIGLSKNIETGQNDPTFDSELKNILSEYDFVCTELNSGANETSLLNNIDLSKKSYLFTVEYTGMEQRSVEGVSTVNFPAILGDDGIVYTDPDLIYSNPEFNPLMNSIDSKILAGFDLGGTSGATVGNAALGALIANFYQRLGKPINKSIFDNILKNHPEIMKPVKYSYYPEGVKYKWENIVWTDQVVAYYLDLEALAVNVLGMFDLHPDLQNLKTLGEVPLFENYEKLDYSCITIGEERGIVWKDKGGEKIPCVSWEKLEHQGLTIDDLVFDIVAAKKNSNSYYTKLEDLKLK